MQGNWGSNGTSGATKMEIAISTNAIRCLAIRASKQPTDRQSNQVNLQTFKPKCEHCVSPAACEFNGRCQKGLER